MGSIFKDSPLEHKYGKNGEGLMKINKPQTTYSDRPKFIEPQIKRPVQSKIVEPQTTYVCPKTKDELVHIIENAIKNHGKFCDLNFIDTSKITDMSLLFSTQHHLDFNGDISKWDVSKVTNMDGMFFGSSFSGDISKWDVSKVTNMEDMFYSSRFNGDISKWNVGKVKSMKGMFERSEFNRDISKWNVKNVKYMNFMFDSSRFNGDISKWNVQNVEDITCMFRESSFNGVLSKWNLRNVKREDTLGVFERSPLEIKYGENGEKWEALIKR